MKCQYQMPGEPKCEERSVFVTLGFIAIELCRSHLDQVIAWKIMDWPESSK